jgi:hypothetical protein
MAAMATIAIRVVIAGSSKVMVVVPFPRVVL